VEGTQIEPAVSYSDQYLNISREWSDRYKGQEGESWRSPPANGQPLSELLRGIAFLIFRALHDALPYELQTLFAIHPSASEFCHAPS